MNCVVCEKELENDLFECDGVKLSLHNSCVTEELKEQINFLFLGYLYLNKGKLTRGFFHKQHEII